MNLVVAGAFSLRKTAHEVKNFYEHEIVTESLQAGSFMMLTHYFLFGDICEAIFCH